MRCFASWSKIAGTLLLFSLIFTSGQLHGREVSIRISGDRGKSRVPAWDAHGLGSLPWQGIACADLTPDGRYVALGTIAPVGDPQVFVLDERGAIVTQHNAGERWINEVAISPDGKLVSAVITMPGGNSGDVPQIVSFANGKRAALRINNTPVGYNDFWHYGDHSNHLPATLRSTEKDILVAGESRVNWVGAGPDFPVQTAYTGGLIVSMATNSTGRVVVGGAVSAPGRNEKSVNLTVVDPGGKPLWQRPVSDDVTPIPAMEQGVYGFTVTPYHDVKTWAPLSVAISTDGSLVAAADYQGWQRLFERGDDYGLHFMPVRPVIQVYTAEGKPVCRFAPETFAAPGWYDLAFSVDNTRLLAYPHNWTSRGLGGQTRLPADTDARSMYALDLATGDVTRADFPDAIAGVAVGANGVLAVSCWNGNIYLRGDHLQPVKGLPSRLNVGTPCVLRLSQDGGKLLAAGANGSVRLFDAGGKQLWQVDLNKLATPGVKPWPKDEHLYDGPGVWMRTGCRLGTDCGNLFIIEAPDGLLLIDPQAGLSNERYWTQMITDGLDPMKVKYVLLTHEHGDHAPGAFLWRLMTGAKVIASPEMAYTLQHHLPIGTGYGFHPPQPIDILVDHDQDMTLAGLKVRIVRLPGHTYGSLGYIFEKDGTRYAVLGDLIMPGGNLGYSGAVDFSAKAVLASLRKLETYKPDTILGGHGGGDPENFIGKGIRIGETTGWGKMPPEKPDPPSTTIPVK